MPRTRHIFADLAAKPKEQVEAELREVQAEKARLEMEEQLLSQVLRLHAAADHGLPSARSTLEAAAASAPEQKQVNLSANVLSVVRQAGGSALSPQEVQKQLAENGLQVAVDAVRVALRRWADRGEIVKDGRVYYARSRPPSAFRFRQE